jgi:hypothetical protein
LPPALTATYNAANQQVLPGPAQIYDLNGNHKRRLHNHTWDARDRLVALTGPG